MTHAMLVNFKQITVKEVYQELNSPALAAHSPHYYYELGHIQRHAHQDNHTAT